MHIIMKITYRRKKLIFITKTAKLYIIIMYKPLNLFFSHTKTKKN